jgi:hypothetical protein
MKGIFSGIMHTRLNERIFELEAELAALKNTVVINDVSAARKAIACGYGKKKFIAEGWDDNVVDARIERTYGQDERPAVYFLLQIQTKTMKIELEYQYENGNDDEYIHRVGIVNDDGTQTHITGEPPGNDFERRLIKMLDSKLPIHIDQFDC